MLSGKWRAICKMITKELYENKFIQNAILNKDDPWSGILATTMFTMRATVHTTLQATTSQLVFGQDSMLNITHDTNWKLEK